MQGAEYSVHGVLENAHNKAVAKCYAALRAGPGKNAAAGEKAETGENVTVSSGPGTGLPDLGRCNRAGNPVPCLADGGLGVWIAHPVFAVPDLSRNLLLEVAEHARVPLPLTNQS